VLCTCCTVHCYAIACRWIKTTENIFRAAWKTATATFQFSICRLKAVWTLNKNWTISAVPVFHYIILPSFALKIKWWWWSYRVDRQIPQTYHQHVFNKMIIVSLMIIYSDASTSSLKTVARPGRSKTSVDLEMRMDWGDVWGPGIGGIAPLQIFFQFFGVSNASAAILMSIGYTQ